MRTLVEQINVKHTLVVTRATELSRTSCIQWIRVTVRLSNRELIDNLVMKEIGIAIVNAMTEARRRLERVS